MKSTTLYLKGEDGHGHAISICLDSHAISSIERVDVRTTCAIVYDMFRPDYLLRLKEWKKLKPLLSKHVKYGPPPPPMEAVAQTLQRPQRPQERATGRRDTNGASTTKSTRLQGF